MQHCAVEVYFELFMYYLFFEKAITCIRLLYNALKSFLCVDEKIHHDVKDPNRPSAAAALTAAAAAASIISETGVGAKSPSPPIIILFAEPLIRAS